MRSSLHSHSSNITVEDEQRGSFKGFVGSKTGFLTKRAMSSMGAFANWKQRFFVLSEGRLCYYKQNSGLFTSKDNLAHLKGEITLSEDSIVRKSNIDDKINCFEISTPSKKLFCQADSATEMVEWISAIQSHIDSLRQLPSLSNITAEDSKRSLTLDDDPRLKVTDSKKLRKLVKELLRENNYLRQLLEEKDPRGSESPALIRRSQATVAPILDLREIRKKQFELWDAAEEGNLEVVEGLLQEAVVDVNGKSINEWTALHLAVYKNRHQIAKKLLESGASVDIRTRDRLTALSIAAKEGHLECVDLLLKADADPCLTDQAGNSSLHFAAETGQINVVKLLLDKGAKADAPNASGSLPYHLSPIGHPIRVLLSGGLNIKQDAIENQKQTSIENKDDVNLTFRNIYAKQLSISPQDFEFVKVLGRGAFAKVYLVRGKGINRDKWFALKAYNKEAILQKNQARYILTEKAALQACSDHPYIVTLHYSFQSKDRLFLVMDYCGGGDLLSALSKHKRFNQNQASIYIAEIVLALGHLHSKKIIFRDLKPENVVLDMEGHAMLTDFGISKEGINDHCSANTFCGSPMYLAPEMLSRSGHGPALDWYSVGALLYELLTGLPPFYTNDKKQLFHNILKGHLPIPDYISSDAKSLIQGLLCRDPNARLGSGSQGVKRIMTHPFFKHINWEDLYNRKIPAPFKPEIAVTASGVPDISNFPQAFTDQAISDQERGLDIIAKSFGLEDKRVFKDFDFQPEIALSEEAKEFERMMMGQMEDTERAKSQRLDDKSERFSDKSQQFEDKSDQVDDKSNQVVNKWKEQDAKSVEIDNKSEELDDKSVEEDDNSDIVSEWQEPTSAVEYSF